MTVGREDFLVYPDDGGALGGHTLPAIFAAAAAVGPDMVAASEATPDGAGTRDLTWSAWRQEANAVARGLQACGVSPGDVVAVQLPNSCDFLVLHIAVALVGAVLLPLHARNGVRELTGIVAAAGPVLAVVSNGGGSGLDAAALAAVLRSASPALGQVLVAGEGPGTPLASLHLLSRQWAGTQPEPVEVRPDSPLLLVPTSGTTSLRPKLSIHSHDALLSNAHAVAAGGGALPTDAVLSTSPFSHLFGLLSLHLSICVAARQILLGGSWDVDRFLRLATRTTPTLLFAVPAQLRDLVGAVGENGLRLREVRTAGAPVPAALVRQVIRTTGATVVIQWGMTEVGAGISTRPGDDPGTSGHVIGRPIEGGEVWVVGEDGCDCGPDEAGELLYRSPFLFRGYLREPELTRSAVTAEGWLRTGDLASLDRSGLVSFHGRASERINVGGEKFNALEIEELLAGLPSVSAVAVIGRPDDRLGEYPCVVMSTHAGEQVTLDDVTRHLVACQVASYKFPLDLVLVDQMPTTASGKVARGRLRAQVFGRSAADSAGGRTAPRPGEVLQLVRKHAAEVVGRRPAGGPIGVQQTFRDYGLDSGASVRLRNRLAEATGQDLPTTLAFDFPTPLAVTGYLLGNREEAYGGPARSIDHDDPVVIVGMACALPGGVSTPEDFWRLLIDGAEVLSDFPDDRGWRPDRLYSADRGQPGKTYTCRGGFLDGAGDFDNRFFAVSPRDAVSMDPQHRLLLEVSWEALERAGITAEELRDSETGVFTGLMAGDYRPHVHESPESFDGTMVLGNLGAVASGRLAYILGLRGPAMTLDTACSSSLVALHLAVRSLRDGECDLAIVGGATVMSTPATFVDFSRQGVLSAEGRCKPFAADADGAVWSEGAAAVVVERLTDARRRGHPVLAMIRGSALNQDGASNGLTAPNGVAQQRVIRRALRDARLDGRDVDLVEAHGTGTALGDPIEAQALLAAYAGDRCEGRPLWVGSVKSNLGHTQAAAGLVSVLKAVLALQHATLPKTLHALHPTPRVNWAPDRMRLLTQTMPWPDGPPARRAGVSAFGMSGTNAHVILEEAPPAPPAADQRPDAPILMPFVLSGKDERSLAAQAARLRAHLLARPEIAPADVGYSLATTRSHFEHRAGFLGYGREDLLVGLDSLATGVALPTGVRGRSRQSGGVVFVFPGPGCQWPGMAARLMEAVPVFAVRAQECADALAAHLDWSVSDLLRGRPGAPPIDCDEIALPAVFAVMVALAEVWRSRGVHPGAVLGHAGGEVAAACVAGALSLPDAAMIIAARSRADVERRREELLEALAGSTPRPAEIPVYSAVAGGRIDTSQSDHPYWYGDPEQPVCIEDTVRVIIGDGHDIFIEISPHFILGGAIEQVAAGADVAVLGSLRRDDGGPDRLIRSAVEAHTRGVQLDWDTFFGDRPQRVDLPTYAFQRDRFWLATAATRQVTGPDRSAAPTATGCRDALFRAEWQPLRPSGEAVAMRRWATLAPLRSAPSDHEGLTQYEDLTQYEGYGGLRAAMESGAAAPETILVPLTNTPGPATEEFSRVHEMTCRVLAIVQDWLADDRLIGSRLVVVTTGAVAVPDRAETPDLALAAVWGMVRSAQSENPGRITLVDSDGEDTSAAMLPVALACREPQLAVRSGTLFAFRLARAATPARTGRRAFDVSGTVLITGGTGALAGALARHVAVEHRARHLLLASRRGLAAPGARELAADLTASGAEVTVAACDLTDAAEVTALLGGLPADRPLTAVVHCAGIVDDGVVEALSPDKLARVMAPKVAAALHLHEATRDLDLSAFVLFSSAAATFGAPGQGNYAAANAALDALAEQRRAQGLAALSLAWGLWALPSALTGHLTEADIARHARSGVLALSTQEALELFDVACGHPAAVLVPARLDLTAIAGRTVPPLLAGLIPAAPALPAVWNPAPEKESSPLAGMTGLTPADRETVLLELVLTQTVAVLGYASPADVDPGTAFRDLGIDSLGAVELRNRVADETGLRLPATVIFDYPSPARFAAHLLGRIEPDGTGSSGGAPGDELSGPVAAVPSSRRGTMSPPTLPAQVTRSASVKGPTAPVLDKAVDLMGADELINLVLGRHESDS